MPFKNIKNKGLIFLILSIVIISSILLIKYSGILGEGSYSNKSDSNLAMNHTKELFETDKGMVKIRIKEGETFRDSIEITNSEGEALDINAEVIGLEGIIELSESAFTINKGESKRIDYSYKGNVPKSGLGVYTGSLILRGLNYQKIIPIVIEIESKEVLFDVSLEVPAKYEDIQASENAVAQISLFNLIKRKEAEVGLYLKIKDFKGTEIANKSEVMAVDTQASFTREIKIPEDIKPGEYAYIAIVKYGESVGTSSDIFQIGGERAASNSVRVNYKPFIVIGLIILWVICGEMVYEAWKLKNIESLLLKSSKKIYQSHKRREVEGKEKLKKIPEEKRAEFHRESKAKNIEKTEERLKKQLSQLERAYQMKYISESAYLKGKAEIGGYLKKILK